MKLGEGAFGADATAGLTLFPILVDHLLGSKASFHTLNELLIVTDSGWRSEELQCSVDSW